MKIHTKERIKPTLRCAASGTAALAPTPSSITLRAAMDFFQHRYYRLTKTLMTLVGYWPYQNTRTRFSRSAVMILIIAIYLVSQILALVKYRDERNIVVECIIVFLFEASCAIKGISCLWYRQQIMKLLNGIRTDWLVWSRDREVNILHEYAEWGREMSLAFTAEVSSVAFIYVAQPTVPKIIDILLKNGTAPGQFPFPADYYYIDMQKYYFSIITYFFVCMSIGAIVLVTSEIIFIIFVQHVCGVFAALGCKLRRISNNNTSVQSGGTSYDLDQRNMVDLASCIDRHNGAIDYANLIEAIHRWHIFYVVGMGMILFNLIGLQIIWGQSNPETTVRFIGFALTIILYLYVECYISQILTNHSISIHLYIYDSQWYKLPPKSQKLLRLMIMRCGVPCNLTVGNFFVLSMRNFGQVMRTAMSYFAVVRSMQI